MWEVDAASGGRIGSARPLAALVVTNGQGNEASSVKSLRTHLFTHISIRSGFGAAEATVVRTIGHAHPSLMRLYY